MKVNVEVFQDPSDGLFAVRTRLSDADGAPVGEFTLPAGNTMPEAETMARSLIKLAETGFDIRKLIPEG